MRGLTLQGYENEYHNSTKLLVGNGYLLKLLFSGKQPVVVRELGHGQLKWLGRYSMPPSMLKKKKFFEGAEQGEQRNRPSQDSTEL